MIDKSKIKSAAQGYCDATYGTLNEHPLIAEAFREGAQWADDNPKLTQISVKDDLPYKHY